MYTAKLNLSPDNVDDVLAVASFLQMQDIITACHTLRSLAEPTSTTGENTEASGVEGKVIGRPFLKSGFLWCPCPTLLLILGHLTGSQIPHPPAFTVGAGKGPCACPFLTLGRSPTGPLGAQEQSSCPSSL